ncbi:MAG: cbb3-type cytochrome oxidase assembly protein CcoS [Syntrophobacteraceae bacterium]
MIYYAGWLLLVVISLGVSLAAFIWGLRAGQFSDQDRARYLPLGEDLLAKPIEVASPRKQKIQTGALIAIFLLGLTAVVTALALSLHYR